MTIIIDYRLILCYVTILIVGLHAGFLYSSGCLTMLIAVERCLCVAMPLKAANLVRTRTMTAFIVATVLSLHLLCIIYTFKFDVVATVNEGVEI